MKTSGIFYDSANLEDFKRWFDAGILGGVTTNPVILQKEGVFNIPDHISKIIEITGTGFPVSVEVPDSNMGKEEMFALALAYHEKFPKNIVVKIPMDPREPEKAFEVIRRLRRVKVPTNATLGLTSGQLIGAMEAGADYVSLFWGRCGEISGFTAENTLNTVLRYREVHDCGAKIIVGSIRNTNQIDKAFSLGADIVTIPPKLINDWMFTQRGVETADEFNKAYRDVKDKMILI